jgi:DNA-binding CsgD family transcriptional regulator
MVRSDPRGRRVVRAIRERLETIGPEDGEWWNDVLPEISRLIAADVAAAYRLDSGPSGLEIDFLHSVGFHDLRLRSELEAFIRSKQGHYAAFDPVCPQTAQRNTALANADIAAVSGVHPRSTVTYRELLPRYGLERSDQLRALVCEGSSLLAWVGGFRADPFRDQDRRDLQAIVPALQHRLLLERLALRSRVTSALLPIAMETLGVPAFVVARNGSLVEANSFGKAWLASDPATHAARLRKALQLGGEQSGFQVVRVELGSAAPAYFVWRPAVPSPPAGIVDQRAREWRLTGRQHTALRLLAMGLSNKAVATEMKCAEKTVEVHVSAILKKAGASSRTSLLSKLFFPAADR